MSKIKKIKKIYDEIISRFNKLGGNELFYNYNSEKLKPIIVGNSEKEIENLMENKIKKHADKYKNATLVRIKVIGYRKDIGLSKEELLTSGGAFGLMAMIYKINDKLNLTRANEHRQQSFWYSDEELLNRGFSSKDIKLIIKAVYNNLVDMSPFAIYNISEVDNLFKKKKNID